MTNKDTILYERPINKKCFYCSNDIVYLGRDIRFINTYCEKCDSYFLYNSFGNPLQFEFFTSLKDDQLPGKYDIIINISTLTAKVSAFNSELGDYELVCELPNGLKLTPQNIKEKLKTYLTFI